MVLKLSLSQYISLMFNMYNLKVALSQKVFLPSTFDFRLKLEGSDLIIALRIGQNLKYLLRLGHLYHYQYLECFLKENAFCSL